MATISLADRLATLKVRPSLPDHRDQYLMASSPNALPKKSDLGVIVPIKEQGRQGSCTGHGYSSMREALDAIHGLPSIPFSRAFIYAMERIAEHTLDADAGAYPIDGCKVLKNCGVCPETDMPYNDLIYNVAPSQVAMKDATKHTIAGYARLIGVGAIKTATVNRMPTGFGIAVYESFEKIGSDGVVPMPKAGEQLLGGHWVFGNALGYEDDASYPGGGFVTAQNSWGTGFGMGGYIKFPYAYLTNPNYTFEIRCIH